MYHGPSMSTILLLESRAKAVALWALSAFQSRDKLTMLTLYKSLLRSHLEYGCPLQNLHKVSDIQTVEGIQRTFTVRFSGVQHLHYQSRIKCVNLMSLQCRRVRYINIHMMAILHRKFSIVNFLKFLRNLSSRHGRIF